MPPAAPSASFFSLPSEIRIKIYEQVLKDHFSLTLDNRDVVYWPQERLNLSLLRTNKLVHREASPFFYGQNCFDFTGRSSEFARQFFTTIGASNAGCIRHIQIDFPQVDDTGSYAFAPGTASNELLTSIQDACPDLRTITSSIYTLAGVTHEYNDWTDQEMVTALQVIDTRFRASPHLQEIIVDEAGSGRLGVVFSETVNSLGWRINKAPSSWGSDESYCEEVLGHDFEWDEYDGDFIDNDSEIGYDGDDNDLVPVDDFGWV